ncbi:hypothetical protein J6590_055095 [Homalodisca vitripennis]|nr:hypothetical protein J6590_055095 [Homalodisca vitripennis]
MKTVATVGRPTDSATHSQTGQKIVVGEPQTVGGRRVQPSDTQTVWSEKIGPQTAPHTIRQVPDTRPDAILARRPDLTDSHLQFNTLLFFISFKPQRQLCRFEVPWFFLKYKVHNWTSPGFEPVISRLESRDYN